MTTPELFLELHYPEIKQLTVSFLTLTSSIFTFSVVFADKLTHSGPLKGRGHIALFISWTLFIIALILGGLGLLQLVVAADFAKGGTLYNGTKEFHVYIVSVYSQLFASGVFFVGGLILLSVTAFYNLFTPTRQVRCDVEKAMDNKLHTADFFGWTAQQAALLRAGRVDAIDREHLAEEIEDMGKSLQRELVSRLTILFVHLLKWQFQPGYRGNSWRYTIEEQRDQLTDHLLDNPSLQQKVPQALARAYKYARTGAAKETGLAKKTFPEECPWSFEQALDNEVWPE